MSRLLHRIVSVALLGVLSGAPAVAVICAELCAPDAHHQRADHDPSSCHGETGTGSTLTGQSAPDCGDHGAASLTAVASLTASRGHGLTAMHAADVNPAVVLGLSTSTHARTAFGSHASPPRPAPSSPVLRI